MIDTKVQIEKISGEFQPEAQMSYQNGQDALTRWRECMVLIILRGAVGLGLLAIVPAIISDIREQDWDSLFLLPAFYLGIVLIAVMKVPYAVRAFGLIVLTYLFSLEGLISTGIQRNGGFFLIVTVVLAFMFLGRRTGFYVWGGATLTIALIALLVLNQQLELSQTFDQMKPIVWVVNGTVMMILTGIISICVITLQGEFSASEIRARGALNELVEERSHLADIVEDRNRDLRLVSNAGRRVSLGRDLDEMLQESVELIKDAFDLYYAQIYLLDFAKRNLVLRAGTGKVGQQLLHQAHRPVGQEARRAYDLWELRRGGRQEAGHQALQRHAQTQ